MSGQKPKTEFLNFPGRSQFQGLIGVARTDITPPSGIYARNWGAAKHDVANGIHRRLTLTCVTFQSAKSENPLVILAADLGWWKSKEDEWFLRGGVLEEFALHPSRLMVCLSHTHSGPSIFHEDSSKPGGEFIQPYLRLLRESAIAVVRQALKSAVPAFLAWQYGKCDLATNRDLPERGSKRYICGFNPNGKPDDTLLVGRVTGKTGKILATLVNYACHPTTLAWENRLISPDYVGAMREVVETETKAPSAFLQGASGDLAPAEQYVGDIGVADAHGRQLGYAVLSTLQAMLPAQTTLNLSGVVESGAPLAVWKRAPAEASQAIAVEMLEVELPLKPLPSLAVIEQEWRACEDPVLKERLWRKRAVRKTVGDGATTKMPLWIWRLGDSFLIGQRNEPYAQFQQELREKLSPNAVAVMNLVNGTTGYLPPRKLYGKNLYSVWQTPFAKGSFELLSEAALKAARRVDRQTKGKL